MKKTNRNQTKIKKILVGVSSCLLGEKVRYDGGHQEDKFLTRILNNYVEWVPVCPEVEMGLPVPRENLRLVRKDGEVRLIGGRSGNDYTEKMISWSRKKLEHLRQFDLCGYILKKDSPSCGMERVRIYNESGMPDRKGIGVYAEMLMKTFPLLPVEEEGRLNDPVLLENFIERIFAYQRLRENLLSKPSPSGLVKFHTAHKLTLMAHSPVNLKTLGQIVAKAGKENLKKLIDEYSHLFMMTLNIKATPKKHANVLMHLMGYLKNSLNKDDKEECLDLIEQYRLGYVPLVVPLTLIKHHLRKNEVDWLNEQVYLNPYPEELMLRNRI